MSLFLNRLLRALRLDISLFDEVLADPKSQTQAYLVAIFYSSAAAIGAFGRVGGMAMNVGMLAILVAWYIGAFFTYFAGMRLFREPQTDVDRKSVLRALGFACGPGVFRLLGFIPGLGGIVVLTVTVWMIAASTLAVKQAFGFQSIYRAAGVCIFGWVINLIVQGLLLVAIFSVFGVSGQPF